MISKLEEENKKYETLAAGLHNDADELERTINNLEEMVGYHKGEVKKLVEAADMVRDKHENDVCMLKKDIHDLEVKVKYYKEDADDLECEVSKYKALYEGLQLTVDSVTRERNHFEYTLSQLIEQLKIKNDIYVDIDDCVDGVYKVENKRAADLQSDLDAAIYDLKKEEENAECLKKQIIRKNAEMCNQKWEHDETKKKFKILIEELKRLYDIDVTFYQRPGIDMHGLRNFGVNVDCEENRKAFNELKEALDKHKSQIEKLETKHASLLKALDQTGINPSFDIRANKWLIQYTDKAENAFLAADQLKRDAEKKIDDLKRENNNLKQTLLNILETLETKVGLRRIHLLDSYEDRANLIAVEHDRLLIKYEKLKVENNNLITDTKRLSDAVEAWFNMFNDMRHKRDDLKKENKKLEEALNDKNKLICKLTTRKGNVGNKRVPPTGCCGCCNVCTLRDICWILND